MKPNLPLFALLAAASLACPALTKASIALDFGATGQRVQALFAGVSGSGSGNLPSSVLVVPSAALPGGESVTISSSSVLGFRDRGDISNSGYDPYPFLFEDFLRAGNGTAVNSTTNPFSTLTIDVGQLQPLTEYRATFRIYDGGIAPTSAGSYSFNITGTGDTNLANNSFVTPYHSSASPFPGLTLQEREGYSEMFLSDALGRLQMTITQTSGVENSVALNSFELVMIPEPGSAFLASSAGFAILLRRRRRR